MWVRLCVTSGASFFVLTDPEKANIGRSFTSRIAENGWLSLLQWARQNKFWMNEGVCSAAAKIGRLDILQWATENGAWVLVTACKNAAEEGHIEILKWLKRWVAVLMSGPHVLPPGEDMVRC